MPKWGIVFIDSRERREPVNTSTVQSIRGYVLRECLGEGGFGIVYRAEQPSVGREVAIKVVLPQFAN